MGDYLRWAIENPLLSIPFAAFVAWTVLVPKRDDPHGHTYKHSPSGSKGYEARVTRKLRAAGAKADRDANRRRRGW